MSNRDAYYDKFFKIINYTDRVEELDPDYKYIKEAVGTIPTGSLGDFYAFIYDSGATYSSVKTSILSRNMLKRAVRDFTEVLKNGLWIKYNLADAVETLYGKVSSLVQMKKNEDIQTQINFLNSIDYSRLKFTIGDEKKTFDEDEIGFIKERTMSKILEDMRGNLSGAEVKDIMGDYFKNVYAKRYILRGESVETPSLSGSKRLVRMLAGSLPKTS